MIVSLFIVLILLLSIYNHYFPPIPHRKAHYTYALLLGCPSHDDGSMSTSQIKRCNLAIDAYKQGLYDTLIISGSHVKNQYTEAIVMNQYIQKQFSIPVYLETQAKNTYDNFSFSKAYIQNKDVLILTSKTHAKRACAIARQFYTNYSCFCYKDFKLKHIFREMMSRFIYIKIEIQKKIGKH